ncbi:MAG: hypothetical protein ACE5DX_01855 [Candidatus Dojkabacteria bacterium]
MTIAKLVTVLLLVLDFIVGLIFGSIGHFFSILVFPILALLKGSVVPLMLQGQRKNEIYRKTTLASVWGAISFYLGLAIGINVLIFYLTPNYQNFNSSLGPILETEFGMVNGLAGSLLIGAVYVLIYLGIALVSLRVSYRLQK